MFLALKKTGYPAFLALSKWIPRVSGFLSRESFVLGLVPRVSGCKKKEMEKGSHHFVFVTRFLWEARGGERLAGL